MHRLIHLPALDILLGFPVQLLGLLALPYLGIRYLVDNKDVGQDLEVGVAWRNTTDVADHSSPHACRSPGEHRQHATCDA